MTFSRLVLASHNAGKVRELSEMLAPLKTEVISAAALKLPEPEETGSTFEENAALKARAASAKTNLPALSDDSGLCIPALDGAPGIYSARWTGPDRRYEDAFERIRHELRNCGMRDPHPPAYFICVLCLATPDGGTHCFEGRVDGRLSFPPRGRKGFGYDPIFLPEGRSVTFGEMPPAEKETISHRGRALVKLIEFLRTAK